MSNFDPNEAATADSGIFGLPFSVQSARVVYLPVPWDATSSYGKGASSGPKAILRASHQLDLFDHELGKPYEAGLAVLPIPKAIETLNAQANKVSLKKAVEKVNVLSEKLNFWVRSETEKQLNDGKLVGVIGGDHSSPFGAIEAITQRESELGILHIDAHADMRKAYEGYVWSHASIMFNVLERLPTVKKLVQIGIRDFCEEEKAYAESQG